MSATERPLRRDAQRNRERIQAAALELFAERGVEVTLDDVAERAGVGVGTVYRRYPNKDALTRRPVRGQGRRARRTRGGRAGRPGCMAGVHRFPRKRGRGVRA